MSIGVGEKYSGVYDSFGRDLRLFGVVVDFALIFWEKLVALGSLHVVSLVGFGLFVSDGLREFIDKSKDITNHTISSKVQL